MTEQMKTVGAVEISWTDSDGSPQSAVGDLVEIKNGVAVLDWGYGVDVSAKDFWMGVIRD